MTMNIKLIQAKFREIVPKSIRDKWLDLSVNPIQYGYNIFNSYRAGGKTSNELIFALIAYDMFDVRSMYFRSGQLATRAKAVNTLCMQLNTYADEETGKNYVQLCTDDKYTWLAYHSHSKTFRLLKTQEDDLKTAPIFIYVSSIPETLSLKSGFADTSADIIIYDEFIDNETGTQTTITFLNAISTVFRLRYKTICFMNCNLSVGNPIVLRQFGIYEKVLSQTTPYMIYHTKRGMKIAVSILSPSDEQNNDRARMNETYFNFDTNIEGIENIRGASICHESYRELPPDTTKNELSQTGLYFYSCGCWLEVLQVSNSNWQNMYYIIQTIEPQHDNEHLTLTDDKLTAFDTPFTYASIGRDFQVCRDLACKVRRSDVCFDSFMTYICIKSFYDFYRIPETI